MTLQLAQKQRYSDGLDRGEPGARHVLVVDDSRAQRLLLSLSLRKQGYVVTEAGSGEEALALCRGQDFDIVVSDWGMPGMSGLDLCKAFRALPRDTYAYFILVTANSDAADVADGLDSGADDFLSKPVNPDELHARMRAGERILAMQAELVEKNRLVSTTLGRLQDIHEALERDLFEARKLQQALVRERYRSYPQGNVSVLLRPSGHVGGDLAGFFDLGPGRLALFSVDVSGHGVASAMMTARLAGMLLGTEADSNIALERDKDGRRRPVPPEVIAERLNRFILDELLVEQYLTLAYAEVHLPTGRVDLVQAGHPHPLILRADGRQEMVGTGGLPVGLFPEARYERVTLELGAGDRLFLVSDGVTECRNPKEEELGYAGLGAILHRNRSLPPKEFLDALVWDLSAFSQGVDFADDVSGVLFHYDGSYFAHSA